MNDQTIAKPARQIDPGDFLDHPLAPLSAPKPCIQDDVALPPSFITLFQTLEALRAPDRGFILQVVAAHRRAGASMIASGLARAAAQAYRRPVLFVDQTSAGQDGIDQKGRAALAEAVEGAPTGTAFLFRTDWQDGGHALRYAAGLERRFEALRHAYQAVIIDCPALTVSPAAITIARYCDGAALVAAAARSAPREMVAARDTIHRAGGQVLGAVFNRERSYRPRWLGSRD